MGVVTTSQPGVEPVTLFEMKAHLRLVDESEDVYLSDLIRKARVVVENESGRAILAQSMELSLDGFPRGCRQIKLPRPPLLSVTSISYVDQAGAVQVLDPAAYVVDTRSVLGRVVLRTGHSWPVTDDVPNAVIVSYKAGYGSERHSIPHDLRQAVAFLTAHYFANREPVNIGNIVNPIPSTLDSIIWMNRVPEVA